MQHAAVAERPWCQPFSETYCEVAARRASVSSSRFLAAAPPSANVTAASDCAIAIAPVRLGKNPGEEAASNSSRWSAPSAIGAVTAVGDRDQRGAGIDARRAPTRTLAVRVGRKADHDDGIAGTERAEIEIFGTGAADELHRVGPEQAKLVVEQFRDAAAAAKAGDPDPLRASCSARAAPAIGWAEMRARPAASASSLSATSATSAFGPWRRPLARPENGDDLRRPPRFGQRGAQTRPSRNSRCALASRVNAAGSAPASAARSRIERVVAS